jgi:hypothetical protein
VTMRPTARRAAGIACVLLAGSAVAAAALADQPRFASPDAAQGRRMRSAGSIATA